MDFLDCPSPTGIKTEVSTFKGALDKFAFDIVPSQSVKLRAQDSSLAPAGKTGKYNGSSSHLSQPQSPITKSRPSPSPSKKRKRSAGFAPPSKYDHIDNKLTDSIAPNLIVLFIGLNPGIRTATSGHAYSHPSNLFWKLMHSSGCTPRLCSPTEDGDMPRLYNLGLTNIVSRPTKDGSELSKQEMDESVAELEAKIARFRPETVGIVGKSIWESIWRVKHGRAIRKEEFRYGYQKDSERMGKVKNGEDSFAGARVYVLTTTSGLAASMKIDEKRAIWRGLGEWVEERRGERAEVKDEEVKSEHEDELRLE